MLRIYDTLDGMKKEFVPVEEGRVGMYFCGMTVQSEPHVGHMRVAVVSDVFRRYLRFSGYDVTLVINFTDIDDKIIEKAREEGVGYLDIAERNIGKFLEFLHFLGAEEADHYPRATEHIAEIIALVRKLVDEGYAYESHGDVYFEVKRWPARASASISTIRSGIRRISASGRPPRRASLPGRARGASAVQDGTSSARRCR